MLDFDQTFGGEAVAWGCGPTSCFESYVVFDCDICNTAIVHVMYGQSRRNEYPTRLTGKGHCLAYKQKGVVTNIPKYWDKM